jgi:D-ribose pyranose/furanose isomerase RbsD
MRFCLFYYTNNLKVKVMQLNYIDLSSTFRLYSFPDYMSMRDAKLFVKNVVLAKEFIRVKEIEAKNYVRSISGGSYKNYLRHDTAELKATGLESIITALQALYKLNGYSAKYIIIEGM